MYNLDQKIEEYCEELFVDLGLTAMPEERKAEVFARLQDRFHDAILNILAPVAAAEDLRGIEAALEQEDYVALDKLLKHYPDYRTSLEEKVASEFDQIKLSVAEEQKHERETKSTDGGGGAAPATIEPGI